MHGSGRCARLRLNCYLPVTSRLGHKVVTARLRCQPPLPNPYECTALPDDAGLEPDQCERRKLNFASGCLKNCKYSIDKLPALIGWHGEEAAATGWIFRCRGWMA